MNQKSIIYHWIQVLLGIFLLHIHSVHSHPLLAAFLGKATIVGICGFRQRKKARLRYNNFTPTTSLLNIYTFEPITSDTKIPITSLDTLVQSIWAQRGPSRVFLKTPSCIPARQRIIQVSQGVNIPSDNEAVFVSSRGYAKNDKPIPNNRRELIKKGGCAIAAHMLFEDNIVTSAPCITFDYPDEPEYFNFGQEIDLKCLNIIWDEILKKSPDIKIIAIGDCRGCKALLDFAIKHPSNLHALILISPFVSARDLTNQIAKNYLNWLPASDRILHNFFKFYFPSYKEEHDTLMHRIHRIDNKLPIFIGHRMGDYLVSTDSLKQLVHILHSTGNTDLYFLEVSDNNATHSRITPISELQYAVNAFLAQYALPHDATLAALGNNLLEQAHQTAQTY